MARVFCKIIEKKYINNGEYFVVTDNDSTEEYFIPANQIFPKMAKIGDVLEFNKVFKPKLGKYFLDCIVADPTYEIGATFEFKIADFGISEVKGNLKQIVSVIINDGTILEVIGSQWHTLAMWKFETLKCKVLRFDWVGAPKLVLNDDRHPVFEKGKTYPFKVLTKYQKINRVSNKEFGVFEVLGIDGLKYEVPAIVNQMTNDDHIETIDCEVLSINYVVNLSQKNLADPFFITVEKLIGNKSTINKFFNCFFNNGSTDYNVLKLVEQYSTSSAFWIFTYCNKVLPKIFNESISRYDYENAFQVNELVITIEEWIIKKGILQSFTNIEQRQTSLNKATLQLRKRKVIKDVLQVIIESRSSFSYSIIENGNYPLDIQKLQCLIQFSNFEYLDETFYITKLIELTSDVVFNETDLFHLNLLEYIISMRKRQFSNIDSNEYFTLTDSSALKFKNDNFKNKYFAWSYCHWRINVKIGDFKTANLLMARFLREFFYSVEDVELKKSLIYNAYYILNNINEPISIFPVKYSKQSGIEFSFLSSNPNQSNYNKNDWAEINKANNLNSSIKVAVKKRAVGGFEVKYNTLDGFLPLNLTYDQELKNSLLQVVDYTIGASCILVSESFNVFVVRQLPASDPDFLSINNNKIPVKKGLYSSGVVKRVESYGVFLSSIFGDVLLHQKNISHHYWTFELLKQHFKIGDTISFVVLSVIGNKSEVGIKQLQGSRHEDFYFNFLNKIEHSNYDYLESNDNGIDPIDKYENIDTEIQIEKGYCFEQYALTQSDFNDKINTLTFAKQLYSSINSARSFLLNIFTDYFQILILVQNAIKNYSFQNWQNVQLEVDKVKLRIDKKTIQTFPDSDKLIYFLDIISLFNEKSNHAIDTLYNYIQQYSLDSNKKILETIAKVTLANNLMISETKDDFDFSLKNLKIINSYIVSGVFSLKENESDRLQKEIEEMCNYWRGKILQDEGQGLEFKQTYLTPILDTKRKKEHQELVKLDDSVEVKKRIAQLIGDDAVKRIRHSALKSLAAFANSKGGTLLIGVSDNKKITGLETDYNKLKQQDRDGFGKKFDEDVKTYLGESFSSLMDKQYLKFPEGDVLIVEVKPSVDIVFLLKDGDGLNSEDVYIRHLTSTVLLKGKELLKFYNLKFKKIEYN